MDRWSCLAFSPFFSILSSVSIDESSRFPFTLSHFTSHYVTLEDLFRDDTHEIDTLVAMLFTIFLSVLWSMSADKEYTSGSLKYLKTFRIPDSLGLSLRNVDWACVDFKVVFILLRVTSLNEVMISFHTAISVYAEKNSDGPIHSLQSNLERNLPDRTACIRNPIPLLFLLLRPLLVLHVTDPTNGLSAREAALLIAHDAWKVPVPSFKVEGKAKRSTS